MMDRSANMRAIRSNDMRPELAVRSLVHKLGYRYRLHGKDLPGKPDLVFTSRHKVIFVHGCFWHGHQGCSKSRRPSTNCEFWDRKLDETIARDARNVEALIEAGWGVLVIWECWTRDKSTVMQMLGTFINESGK